MFDSPAPRVFHIPPGVDFAGALARGLTMRLAGAAPQQITRVSLTLNTLRAARALRARMLSQSPQGACWLPRISLLSQLGADAAPDAPEAIAPQTRLLALTRLVETVLRSEPALGPLSGAPRLAASLAALLDEFGREGVALEALMDAPPADFAAHWEMSLVFLRILAQRWPEELARLNRVDPAFRRRAEIAALTESWAAAPPQAPVLLAGGTGSVAVTASLMRAVATLPQGAVVLPGFDPDHAEDWWRAVAPGHPYAALRSWLDGLGLGPGDVAPWSPEDAPAIPRARLLAEALRPAPATDGWLAARRTLADLAGPACAGMTLIEAPSPRREAESVALAMRAEIARGGHAELITPDRALARRVAAELDRWGIVADDSAGRPLALTPPAVFLRILARLGFEAYDPADLLALLKHPFSGPVETRGATLKAARTFEINGLRGRRPPADLSECRAHPDLPEALTASFDTLLTLQAAARTGPLDALIRAHRAAAEALAGPALWEKSAGAACLEAIEAFAEGAPLYGEAEPAAYPELFASCLTGSVAEDARRADPRAAILGGLEARAGRAGLTILGGLNEGVWPAAPAPDPWLNRALRSALGLPSPERRTGLAAHDFLNAACASRVILTRAQRAEGKPTEASRLLRRLTTLIDGTAPDRLKDMRARGAHWLALAQSLDPAPDLPAPATRPAPVTAPAARPARLSVTDVENLIRDPYAVYARRVLRLTALRPLTPETGAAERGQALHEAMERYGRRMRGRQTADPAQVFDAACQAALAELAPGEALRRLWSARLARLRDSFLQEDRARLAQGRIVGLERKGERRMETPALTLTARADRIDLRADGRVAIYDYKGSPPTTQEVAAFARQLPLEAAIAAAGGFDDIPAGAVAELAFISLKDGAARALDDPAALARESWAGLGALIAAYEAGAPWLSRARPKFLKYESDYDHLARYGEWRDGTG